MKLDCAAAMLFYIFAVESPWFVLVDCDHIREVNGRSDSIKMSFLLWSPKIQCLQEPPVFPTVSTLRTLLTSYTIFVCYPLVLSLQDLCQNCAWFRNYQIMIHVSPISSLWYLCRLICAVDVIGCPLQPLGWRLKFPWCFIGLLSPRFSISPSCFKKTFDRCF